MLTSLTISCFHARHRFKGRPEGRCLPPLHVHHLHFIPQRFEHLLPERPPPTVPPEAELPGRGRTIRPQIAPCDLSLRLLRLPLFPLAEPLAGVHKGISAAL